MDGGATKESAQDRGSSRGLQHCLGETGHVIHHKLKPNMECLLLNTHTFLMGSVCFLLALEDWVLGQMLPVWQDTEAGWQGSGLAHPDLIATLRF